MSDFAFSELICVHLVGFEVIEVENTAILLYKTHPFASYTLLAAAQVERSESFEWKFQSLSRHFRFLILAFDFQSFESVHFSVSECLKADDSTSIAIVFEFQQVQNAKLVKLQLPVDFYLVEGLDAQEKQS